MGVSVRQFIDSLSSFGILSSAELTSIRTATAADAQDVDCEPLLRDLVRQGKLTKFQATNLYQGRGRGLVFGEYVILDKIGAGGMGQVYKAQHKRMKRVVALKVLPPQAVKSQKSIERFHQEVEVAAKLTHPNIVTAYDAGEAHGMHYLVMEYVDGKDLSSHITKNGPLSLEQTLNVVLQAARGLAYAHDLNIIHRDIKPSNLLVDRKGVVKILDMGLARVSTIDNGEAGKELTADGEVMGTMDYMAPEQAVDTRSADHRADIYSLGCTLYKLYTGQSPYTGETAVQKILAHRDKPVPSLRAARPEAPDMVDRIFQKMLVKDPAARTQSMATIVSSLERMLSGVDDDRSSVMLGAEPMDADAGFLGGSAVGGSSGLGSSLGGSSASGLMQGSSGINVGPSPAQPSVAVRTNPPPLPTTSRSTSPTVAGTAGRDTDAIVRSIMQAKPAPAKESPASVTTSSRLPLYVGLAAAIAIVLGVVGFALTRKSDPPPEAAATLIDKPTQPPIPAASAATPASSPPVAPKSSATAADDPAVKLPEFPEKSAQASTDFFGVMPAKPSGTPPTVAPSPGGNAPSSPPPTSNPPAPPPPGQPAPVLLTPTELTEEVDLLALVDPAKHARGGLWERQATEIVYDKGVHGFHYIDVPFAPPQEYDLTCDAVPTAGNIAFGPGIVFDGQSVSVLANDDKLGVTLVNGRTAYDGANPTFRQGSFFQVNEPVTIICAVRRDRLVVVLNGKRLIDQALDARQLSPEHASSVTPGQLYLRAERGTRFTSLKIAPPRLPTAPTETIVNLAAAFEPTQVVEGIGTASRGGILFSGEPGKHAKLAIAGSRPGDYVVTAVVERAGGEYFGLGLPIGPHRAVAIADYRGERFTGLHGLNGGPVENSPTMHRYGLQLNPGEPHVIRASAAADPKGWRVRMSIDGREIVDHTGNSFFEGGEFAIPDRQALSVTTYGATNWRIARFDLSSADGRRLPVPDTEARAKASVALAVLTQPADGKGASIDDKLLAVDNLRRKAATDLDDAPLRYAALDEALRIAAAAGDLNGAYEAAEDLSMTFDVDPRSVQARVLDVFKAPRSTQADAKKQFADEAFKFAVRAAHAEQWEFALELTAALDKLAGSNVELKRELKARSAEYAFAKTLSEGAAGLRERRAAGDALDPATWATLGKYLCFGLDDWPGGLKSLSQGDDPGLKAVADLELGGPQTGDAKFAVAEKWWEFSEKEKTPNLKWAAAERAALWYRRAAAQLNDKTKITNLGRRMTALNQLRKASNGVGGPRRPLDAVKLGDRWYKAYTTAMNWETAVQTCEQLGGMLTVIDSPAENEAVARLMLQSVSSQSLERASTWIGVSDLEQEGQFRRLDGLPVPSVNPPPASPSGSAPFVKWSGGEPNNSNGDEDCVMLETSLQNGQVTTYWRDVSKNSGIFFVCEWDH